MWKTRLVLDAVGTLICFCAAVLTTLHDDDDDDNTNAGPSPYRASYVTSLWSLLFLVYGTCTIVDLEPKHKPLPIVVDILSLLLLVPSLAIVWLVYNPSTQRSTQFHLYGTRPSLLRIGVFAGATFLRFFVSLFCCCDHQSVQPQRPEGATAAHGDYIPLASHIDDDNDDNSNNSNNGGNGGNGPDQPSCLSAEDRASAWSRFFFCWITPMLHRGYSQQRLEHHDLPQLAHHDEPHRVYAHFLQVWNQSSRPSLLSTLHHLIFWRFYASGFLLAGSMVAGFAQPLLLHALLVHLEERVSGVNHTTSQESLKWTLQLAAALAIVSLLKSILAHQFWIQGIRCGMHTQLALSSHVLRAAMSADHNVVGQEFDTGKLLNLLSTDSSRIVDTNVIPAFHWGTWSPMVTLIVVVANLYTLLGIAAVSGILVTVLFSGLGVWIGTAIKRAAALTVAKRDVRSTLIEQMLRSIRVIKSFSYEQTIQSTVTAARNEEMKYQRRQQYLSMVSAAVSIVGPLLTTAVTFVWFSLAGGKLTASIAFASLAWFNVLRNSLQMIPWAYVATAGSFISIGRLERFFNRARLHVNRSHNNNNCVPQSNTEHKEHKEFKEHKEHKNNSVFVLQNCTIGWSTPTVPTETKEQADRRTSATVVLKDISCTITRGQFVCIMGPVGSGKSTLLSVLCGHLKPLNVFNTTTGTTNPSLYINARETTYAYVGQHAWLRSTTVLENITMYGEKNPIDEDQLRRVIDSCLLGPDLQDLPHGLDTTVGSDGITLSGGQRQRIALARAVYSRRDCILLDDVLSAVDATVRRHILNKCLVDMLKKNGKTIVLVTHDTNVAAHQEIDQIYSIQQKKLMAVKKGSTINAVSMSTNNQTNDRHKNETIDHRSNVETNKNKNKKKNDSNPYLSTKHKGKLSCATIWKYLNAVGYCSVGITVLLFLMGGALSIGQQWYLTVWVHDDGGGLQNRTNGTDVLGTDVLGTGVLGNNTTCCTNVIVYSTISGIIAFVAMARVVVLTCGSLRAATHLHEAALDGMLGAPLVVFSSVRTGVFINRMLGDVGKIDSVLANAIVGLVSMVMQLVQIMGVVTFVAPPVLMLLPFLAYPYYIAAQYYRWSNRDLRRLMSSSRSPLLTQFGETLHGLIVVRAYHAEELTSSIYEQALSTNVRAYFSQWIANQWITVVLECIGIIIIGGTAIATAFTTGGGGGRGTNLLGTVLTPGTAGMVLTFTFNLPGTLMWLVRNFTNMETELVAVERLSECIELIKEEEDGDTRGRVQQQQQQQQQQRLPRLVERCTSASLSTASSTSLMTGSLAMKNVHMRYYNNSPNVLNDLHLNIPAGSKVAVVGRTGAGKSSLFLALQRLYSFTGSVYVDGLPVHTLQRATTPPSPPSLSDIRHMYAYVPQDPILFLGTVRSNLILGMAPEDVPKDDVLWSALARVSMGATVKEWPDQLNTKVLSQGENFSAGERQLLCLARALLCRARILLIDEGMSSVDQKTDTIAHDTFLNIKGCTVLSICHNLGSLDRFDMIIVMDAGKIVECGSPIALLNSDNKGTILHELVKDR